MRNLWRASLTLVLTACGGGEAVCTFNSECAPGSYCAGGACRVDCSPSDPCPGEQACDSFGRCVAPAPGPDSGPADAGARLDAGSPMIDDAGLEADSGAAIDAGPPADAGPMIDAAPPADAGPMCGDGETETCATECGSTGTATCDGGDFGACVPPEETCDGSDEDCDGVTDNGFRAEPLIVTYSGDLTPLHSECTASSIDSLQCNAAAHRYCAARSCTTSGFGISETAGDSAWITCVIGTGVPTTFTELATYHPSCTEAGALLAPACKSAIDRLCVARGYPSGFGPVEIAGEAMSVVCLSNATPRLINYSDLTPHQPTCDGTTAMYGLICNSAIHRYCQALGHQGGYGPVDLGAGGALRIVCVDS